MGTMEIRPLKESDYEKFLFLINQFRETSFTFDEYVCQLGMIRKWGNVWVLLADNEILGTGTLYFEPKFIFHCAKLAHIEDVCVDASHRRHGYGKYLMDFLIHTAEKEGAYKITLDCNDANVAFYTACGFERRGNQMSRLC